MPPVAKKKFDGKSLDEYVDVAERIQDFKDAHPDGSLQTLGWEVVTVNATRTRAKKANGSVVAKAGDPVSATFIVYRAAAFRHPEDPAPGHGIAWEPFPGGTPYTEDSELMNAETAAWGRAIVALGLVANRSLASRQEVRNRREQASVDDEAAEPAKAAPKAKAKPPAKDPAEKVVEEAKATLDAEEVIDADHLAHLRAKCESAGYDADKVRWTLLSIEGVDNVDDVGAAMKNLTQKQALAFEAEVDKA